MAIKRKLQGVPSAEVLPDIHEAITETLEDTRLQYMLVGGLVTDALIGDEKSFISADTQSIVAPREALGLTVRENGTRRDVDILITDVIDKGLGQAVKAAASEAAKGKMVVSVFGFEEHREMSSYRKLSRTLMDWVSHRTIDEAGVLRYELFPLEQEVSPFSYLPWNLRMPPGDTEIPVLHPVGHVLAYKLRSITGLRHKDGEKVALMERKIHDVDESVRAAYTDEDLFQPWARFADAIVDLRNNGSVSGNQCASERARSLDGRLFKAKANLLGTLEKRQMLVRLVQSNVLDVIIRPFNRNH